jgi:hypothetical protein
MQEVKANNRDSKKLYELIKHRNTTSKKTQRINNKKWETHYTELFREEKEITGRKKEKVERENSNNEDSRRLTTNTWRSSHSLRQRKQQDRTKLVMN